MLQSFLLLRSRAIVHVVLKRAEDACRLHRTTALRAEDALDHDAAAHIEGPAVVANPVIVGDFIYAVAALVHRDVASSTEDNEVLVFIVAIVADGALGVLLHNEAALVRT